MDQKHDLIRQGLKGLSSRSVEVSRRVIKKLDCQGIANEHLKCRNSNIDLKKGLINQLNPLKRLVFNHGRGSCKEAFSSCQRFNVAGGPLFGGRTNGRHPSVFLSVPFHQPKSPFSSSLIPM